ncbi:MAG: HlyD family secretion protein [Rhodocyclales bacterium GT-UBC]|nr:MAG: HlyD family secretion protein [Rhodocyclales bacterium GT-UBC]
MSENTSSPQDRSAIGERRNRLLIGFGGGLAVVSLLITAYWFFYGSHFVSTDNAYAAVEIAQVTPAVSGTIAEVRVKDTQSVNKGDVLVVIDPSDAKLNLAQAEAELGRAIRRVKGYVANDQGLSAQVAAREAEEKRAVAQLAVAEADFERAAIDLQRREALIASGSVSGDELTRVQSTYASAKANLAAAKASATQAQANRSATLGSKEANAVLIADASEETNPEVALARAKRDQAVIDLERTIIRSPVDGVIAKRQVQLGQRVQAGSILLSVVPIQEMHIDANFKEGQLEKVRVGQTASVTADIYGSSVTYHGVVEGFSAGSGAAFAAIPAQNATGNWIKVVQRLPVRIRLNAAELQANPLKAGLSMAVRIDTRMLSD